MSPIHKSSLPLVFVFSFLPSLFLFLSWLLGRAWVTQKRTPNLLTRNTASEVLDSRGPGRHPLASLMGGWGNAVRGGKEEGWFGANCALEVPSHCQAGSRDGGKGGSLSLQCPRGASRPPIWWGLGSSWVPASASWGSGSPERRKGAGVDRYVDTVHASRVDDPQNCLHLSFVPSFPPTSSSLSYPSLVPQMHHLPTSSARGCIWHHSETSWLRGLGDHFISLSPNFRT